MNATRIPDITLERYLLNELPAERMRDIQGLLDADPSLRKRLDDIRKSSGKILRRYRPESMVPKILARASLPEHPGSRIPVKSLSRKMLLIPSLAAAAVAASIIIFPIIKSGNDTIVDHYAGDVTRIKGAGTGIYIYRKQNNSAELLSNNRRVREKDLLQIAYYSTEDIHGMILSLDGRGTVTIHYPRPPSMSTRIEKNRKILLPASYELDDAPGFERFIFITSRVPLDVRAVSRAAEKLARKPGSAKKAELTIDRRCRQTSLVLLKD